MNAYPFTPSVRLRPEQMMERKAHWEHIYSIKAAEDLSWHQAKPETSLSLIEATGVDREAMLIDVGGGDSTLVDYLLDAGYQRITVLDIAANAIERAKARLGSLAREVTWLEQDVTAGLPERQYHLWHDRAVFHFLTEAEDRQRYIDALTATLKPDGHFIVCCFAPDGPDECSGRRVERYGPEALREAVGDRFCIQETRSETHRTPNGTFQPFVYCWFKRSVATSEP